MRALPSTCERSRSIRVMCAHVRLYCHAPVLLQPRVTSTCPSTHFLRSRYMSHRPYDTQPRHCALPVFGWRGTGLVLLPCRLASACCSSCGVACAACLRQCVNGFRHIVLGQEVRCVRTIATVIWKPSATDIQLQLLCAHYASYFLVVS